ncbi:MAG TPA: hypothetical protein VGL38_04865 [bacterium]|jgi:hypothetical protein
MKVVLVLALAILLALPTFSMAQIVSVSDKGCTLGDCPPLNATGCTSASFTVPTTGEYALDAWVVCPDHDCRSCYACTAIYLADGSRVPIATCGGGCGSANCGNTCTVRLAAGQTYIIGVCLEPCPTGAADCSPCRDCTANACVRYPNTIRPCY